eukprot:403363931
MLNEIPSIQEESAKVEMSTESNSLQNIQPIVVNQQLANKDLNPGLEQSQFFQQLQQQMNNNLPPSSQFIQHNDQSHQLEQIEDLKALIEDANDILKPFQLFLVGLLVGRSHSRILLGQAIDLMITISQIKDENLIKHIELEIIANPFGVDIVSITQRAQSILVGQLQQNQSHILSQSIVDLGNEENDQDFNESIAIIQKELTSLDPQFTACVLGGEKDCPFRQQLEQSELARIHLETRIDQQKQKHAEIIENLQNKNVIVEDKKGDEQSIQPVPIDISQYQPAFYRYQFEEEKKQELFDLEMAKKLQEEFKQEERKEYQNKQIPVNNVDKIVNQITCNICLRDFKPSQQDNLEMVTLKDCRHIFHKECIGYILDYTKSRNEIPIFNCPFPNCQKNVAKEDVETYLNYFQTKVKRDGSLSSTLEYACCPTSGCPFVYKKPIALQGSHINPKFECPVCEAIYCLKCKKDYHFGIACKNGVDQEEEKFQHPQKKCPKCKYWVSRKKPDELYLFCRCSCKFCYYCSKSNCKCQRKINKDPMGFYQRHNDIINLQPYLNNPYYSDKIRDSKFGSLAKMKEGYRNTIHKKNGGLF